MADFDVCVIGAGPAGYAAAMRAYDFGKRVGIVERSLVGGTGLHNGALASKTLWELSRDYQNACVQNRGFRAESISLDYPSVVECVRTALGEKTEQLRRQIDVLSKPSDEFPGSLSLIAGAARFVDANTIEVTLTESGPVETVSADHFVIATGSRPRVLPEFPVDGERVITSDHVMNLERFPESLVIVGAGVVGCEFATIFANFGKTRVFLIDRKERILPFEDEDISTLCSRNLEAHGVKIHHRAQLLSLKPAADGVRYTIEHPGGEHETIHVERALLSIGRVPNTEGLNLEGIGVELGSRRQIVDDDTRTSVPNIFAVGDVTVDIALVNIAEIEGRHAIERMYGAPAAPLSYENLSTIMFLSPEVAAIGLNEQQAQEKKIPYKVAVYGYNLVNRAIAMRATDGFLKLIVGCDDDMCILGMRALGVHASTTIEAVSLMMQLGRPVRELGTLIHPHPAITEGLQDCVRMLEGTSIFKPQVFRTALRLSEVEYDADGKARLRTHRSS